MFENWHWIYLWGTVAALNLWLCLIVGFLGGSDRFRHGEITKEATQQAMTVNQANNVNAEKADTLGTVTVKASKGFRFGTVAANDSSVLLAA